jgi:hypothetical protein
MIRLISKTDAELKDRRARHPDELAGVARAAAAGDRGVTHALLVAAKVRGSGRVQRTRARVLELEFAGL